MWGPSFHSPGDVPRRVPPPGSSEPIEPPTAASILATHWGPIEADPADRLVEDLADYYDLSEEDVRTALRETLEGTTEERTAP